MKNQEIKMLLLEVAKTFKKIAMELGEENEEVKNVKEEVNATKKEEPEIKFVDVRKICSEKVEKDKNLNDEIREIIRSYGVRTLSEIDSKYYAEIIERVSKL